MAEQHHHRSNTNLHQSNKKFKSRHNTKSSIKQQSGGKVESVKSSNGPKTTLINRKADKRNALKIEQQKKRQKIVDQMRLFKSSSEVAKICVWVPLCPGISFDRFGPIDAIEGQKYPLINLQKQFKQNLQFLPVERQDSSAASDCYKTQDNNYFVMKVLDAVSVADFVVFGLSAVEEVDELGRVVLAALRSFGIPSSPSSSSLHSGGSAQFVSVVLNMNQVKQKHQASVKKSLIMYMEQELGGQKKDHRQFCFSGIDGQNGGHDTSEWQQLCRCLCGMSVHGFSWRAMRPYFLIDRDVQVGQLPEEASADMELMDLEQQQFLVVQGVNRGMPFNVNRLVHLKNVGELQVAKIVLQNGNQLVPNADKQEDLVHENYIDPMSLEQTWPTEDELMGSGSQFAGSDDRESNDSITPAKKAVTHEQAWLDVDNGDYNVSEPDQDCSADSVADGSFYDNSEDKSVEEDDQQQRIAFHQRKQEGSMDGESRIYSEAGRRYREMKEYMRYPDEADPLPPHMPAKERYQKYRGLPRGFRSAEWDPYENLPVDYGRIFQFAVKQDGSTVDKYQQIKQHVFGIIHNESQAVSHYQQDEMEIENERFLSVPGQRVTVYIKLNPDQAQIVKNLINHDKFQLSLFGLLPFEQKLALMNMSLRRRPSDFMQSNGSLKSAVDADADNVAAELERNPILKSKDKLLVVNGFRTYLLRPLFSQFTQNDEAALSNKCSQSAYMSKFEKFVGPGSYVVASAYAPVTLGSDCPVLYFMPHQSDSELMPKLVGSGVTIQPNANRMIVKRKVLTGHPTRISPSRKSRRAVVKYMFSNREDVEYFSPLPLTTQMGRQGNFIRSSSGLYQDDQASSGAAVGYTGAFKAHFDRQLKSWDVVKLQLYRRVFPKWIENGYESMVQVDADLQGSDEQIN